MHSHDPCKLAFPKKTSNVKHSRLNTFTSQITLLAAIFYISNSLKIFLYGVKEFAHHTDSSTIKMSKAK